MKKTYIGFFLLILIICFSLFFSKNNFLKEKPKLVIIDDQIEEPIKSLATNKTKEYKKDISINPIKNIRKQKKAFTLMVYMSGSDIESKYYAASKDLVEMMNANVDYSNNNVIVYVGGTKSWRENIPNNHNSLIDMSNGISNIVAQTEDSENMGNPYVLSSFINYCTENYPADNYGLIMWDHGGGPIWGCCSDELFSFDSLTLSEMDTAMKDTIFNNQKLNFIGFDACLMSSLEIANTWQKYADYMIASQEIIPGDGWNYDALSSLSNKNNYIDFYQKMIDGFAKHYDDISSNTRKNDYSLFLIDLNEIENINDAATKLFSSLNEYMLDNGIVEINKIRYQLKEFGDSQLSSKGIDYNLIDINNLCDSINTYLPAEANTLLNSINKSVKYKQTNIDKSGGLSLYFPKKGSEIINNYLDEGVLSNEQDAMILTFLQSSQERNEQIWELNEIQKNENEMILQLTEEQKQNAIAVQINVFDIYDYGYIPVFSDCIDVDQDGKIHIPYDPKIISLKPAKDSPYVSTTYFRRTNKNQSYKNLFIISLGKSENIGFLDAAVKAIFSISVKDEVPYIESIRYDDTNNSDFKNDLDIEGYHGLLSESLFLLPPDKDSSNSPFMSWKQNTVETPYDSPTIDSSFKAIYEPISYFRNDYCFQLTILDSEGVVHATSVIDFPKSEVVELDGVSYKLENGEYVVVGCDKSAQDVNIQSDINGVKVTKIGKMAFHKCQISNIIIPDSIQAIEEKAFSSCNKLTKVKIEGNNLLSIGACAFGYANNLVKINLPDSLISLGSHAFEFCNLNNIVLPAKLKFFNPSAFSQNTELKNIKVDNNNNSFIVDNGVIYTKDKKTLVMFTDRNTKEFVIPEGVETIGSYAATISYQLEEVTFPSTLKKIEHHAFMHCMLKKLLLPESLDYIGDGAFSYVSNFTEDIDSLFIGKNIKYIGENAFSWSDIKDIVVDDNNKYYKCKNGTLTDALDNSILFVTMDTNFYNIPEGETTITKFSLPSTYQILHSAGNKVFYFVIPDSVYRFSSTSFEEITKITSVEILCNKDSAAEDFAKRYEIPYTIIDTSLFKYQNFIYEENDALFDVDVINNNAIVTITLKDHFLDSLIIPEKINNIPVTEFYFKTSYALKELTISKNINKVFVSTLDYLLRLEKINVDEDNKYFKDVDGILYDKDLKTLIFCPVNYYKSKVFVEKSVDTIGNAAFSYNDTVEDIVFNDNLQIIEDEAFYSSSLKSINLPKNLKTIGEYAFCDLKSYKGLSIPDSVEEIGINCFAFNPFDYDTLDNSFLLEDNSLYLGKNLKILGRSNFTGLDFSTIDLNPENKNFIISDGNLLTKDGSTIVLIPSLSEKVIIPEGVTFSNYGVFANLTKVKEIYLPNSFVDTIEIEKVNKDVIIYGKPDSKIKQILISNDFTWVDIE